MPHVLSERPCLPRALVLTGLAALVLLVVSAGPAAAQGVFPGGFVEKSTSGEIRPRLSASQIQSMLPSRGLFTFPAPYNTQALRLTNASDCGGSDCVNYVGYSYWRNMNNHAGSDTMLIFLGLSKARGGGGPTLFSYDKTTEEVRNLGPLFPSTSRYSDFTAEGWYFSATQASTIYLPDGPALRRYDVASRQMSTVFDVTASLGTGRYIWQVHSSSDDRVHSATVRSSGSGEMLGCAVYDQAAARLGYYPKLGAFDECQVDKSGRWLVIKENVDGRNGEDNRIIDLVTGVEQRLLDENGAGGHSDLGYGYMVAEDNFASLPGAVKVWQLGQSPLSGTLVYSMTDWNVDMGHVSHANAAGGAAAGSQFACSSHAGRLNLPRSNEIICWPLDGSLDLLVVAPVMTDLNASGGGDDYSRLPKGNVDVTGRYFIWTSNMGGSRQDAFIVKVPSHLLGSVAQDTTPPVVSLMAPATGSTASGSVAVSAQANDDTGVAGVTFRLDGVPLASEDATAPYAITWNSAACPNGSHTLTAMARDAAGNTTQSAAVTVTVSNTVAGPVIASVSTSSLTSTGALVSWITDTGSSSQVEYGASTAYGTSSPLQTGLVVAHSVPLSGLAPATVYHYRVRSRDAAGVLAVSGDFTFTTAPASGPAGLIAHWKLDETTGYVARDASASGYHGMLANGVSRVAGHLNGALRFDGVNDYVAVSHRSPLNAYPITVAAWIRTGRTGTQALVNKYAAGSLNGYQLFTEGGRICAWYWRDATSYVSDDMICSMGVAGYNDDRWHHVAFVVDPAGGRLYVDGAQKSSVAWTGTPGPITSVNGLYLGRYPLHPAGYLGGEADDVRIYGGALSAAEIAALAGGAGGVVPPATTPQPVVWTSLVNCTASGGSLSKTSGASDMADAGAVSQQRILAGDGYVEFSVSENSTFRYAGLGGGGSGTAPADIVWAIRLQAGYAEVRENGVYRSDVRFIAGDRFRIAVTGGVIRYSRNGTVFYTSTLPAAYPLALDTTLVGIGAEILDAVMAGGS